MVRPASVRLHAVLVAGGLVAAVSTQSPSLPPGFAATPTLQQAALVPFVRAALALAPQRHLIAIHGDVFVIGANYQPGSHAPVPILSLANDDVAFLHADGAGGCYAGSLRRGWITHLDPAAFAATTRFAGPANAFDAALLPGGDLLLAANPLWPAANAHTGVWLVGPGRVPREILALVGPSGPLLVTAAGDLVVAELGPIVPPPPGAARLLRIPAARLLWAIGGGTLTMSDVTAIGTGFTGIYDCVEDDTGRLLVSDPASSVVTHTASGGLSPIGTLIDAGGGRLVTTLRFVPGTVGPFRGYQPPAHAASLHDATSDYTSLFELVRVAPRRPAASIAPAPIVAPGVSTLQVSGGPPNGVVLWLASSVVNTPEAVVWSHGGVPLWLGLPPAAITVLTSQVLDGAGTASTPFTNPGGFAVRVDLQGINLAPGLTDLGSTPVLPIQLLP